MKRRGHPVLGAIAGFFFFLSLDLVLLPFGVLPFNSIIVVILPILGIIVGIVIGLTAPFGRGPRTA